MKKIKIKKIMNEIIKKSIKLKVEREKSLIFKILNIFKKN